MGNTGRSKWGGVSVGYTPPGKDKGKTPGRPPKDKELKRDDELDGYDIGGIPEHSKPKKGKGKKGGGTDKSTKSKKPKEKEEQSEIDKLLDKAFPKEPRGPRRKLTEKEKRLKELKEQERNTPERIAERERMRAFRNLSPEEKEKYFQEQREWNKHVNREYKKFEKQWEASKVEVKLAKQLKLWQNFLSKAKLPANSPTSAYTALSEKFKAQLGESYVARKEEVWREKLNELRAGFAKGRK